MAVAERPDDVPAASALVSVPGGTDGQLAPLVHSVRAQQLALHLARARGVDPDRPFGLSKVTATE